MSKRFEKVTEPKPEEEAKTELYRGFTVSLDGKEVNQRQKQLIDSLIAARERDLVQVSVIYHNDCKCPGHMLFVLDRYPMSPVIIHQCQLCGKYCHALISNPIRFYIKQGDREFGVKDITAAPLYPDDQMDFLLQYRIQGLIDFLNEKEAKEKEQP